MSAPVWNLRVVVGDDGNMVLVSLDGSQRSYQGAELIRRLRPHTAQNTYCREVSHRLLHPPRHTSPISALGYLSPLVFVRMDFQSGAQSNKPIGYAHHLLYVKEAEAHSSSCSCPS